MQEKFITTPTSEEKKTIKSKETENLTAFLMKQQKKIMAVLMSVFTATGIAMETQGQKTDKQETITENALIQTDIKETLLKKEQTQEKQEVTIPSYEYTEANIRDLLDKVKELKQEMFIPPILSKFYNETTGMEYEESIKLAKELDQNSAEKINNKEINYEGWRGCVFFEDTESMIKNIIQYTLPKDWLNGNVAKIKFIPETKDMEGNPLLQIAEVVGGDEGEPSEINVYEPAVDPRVRLGLNRALIHESIHCEDYKHFNKMPLGLRIELLYKIKERVQSGNIKVTAFLNYVKDLDSEVEKTEIKDLKWIKLYKGENLTEEYWAYCFEEYLRNPDSPELLEADREIFEWYLEKIDPNFNARLAAKLRIIIMEKEIKNIKKMQDGFIVTLKEGAPIILQEAEF